LLRSEGIVFAIVLAGFAVLTRRSTDDRGEYAFVVGVVASTLAVFALNTLVYGYALGVHSRQVLEDARLVDHLTSAVVRAVRLTGNFVLHVPLTLFVLFYCAVVLRRGRPWPLRGAIGICVPCLLFLAALPLITPNPGGKQLGPRYTLLLPPAFALLVAVGAADLVSRRQRSRKLALALLGVALTVGVAKNAVANSIRLVNDYRTRVAPALRFVRASDASVVVVNDTGVAQELEAAMGTKVFLLALTPAEITRAGRVAAALGQTKVVLGTFADAPVQALPAGMKAEKPESLGGFRFYELSLLHD